MNSPAASVFVTVHENLAPCRKFSDFECELVPLSLGSPSIGHEFQDRRLPNGVREIVVMLSGLLLLADYLRGKVYVYDVQGGKILHTLLVGRKPEAMAIGLNMQKLYVASDCGITVFELPALLRERDLKGGG